MLRVNKENRINKQPLYEAVKEWTTETNRLTHLSRRGEIHQAIYTILYMKRIHFAYKIRNKTAT